MRSVGLISHFLCLVRFFVIAQIFLQVVQSVQIFWDIHRCEAIFEVFSLVDRAKVPTLRFSNWLNTLHCPNRNSFTWHRNLPLLDILLVLFGNNPYLLNFELFEMKSKVNINPLVPSSLAVIDEFCSRWLEIKRVNVLATFKLFLFKWRLELESVLNLSKIVKVRHVEVGAVFGYLWLFLLWLGLDEVLRHVLKQSV